MRKGTLAILIICLALPNIGPVLAATPVLDIQPDRPLLDDVLDIRISGLPPESLITVRAVSTDDSSQLFQSFASFRADSKGAVYLARQTPIAGTYQGIDPMGLFWSMNVASPLHSRAGFHLEEPHAINTTLIIEADGELLLQKNLTRYAVADHVSVQEVNEPEISGRLYRPAGEGPFPAVIWLGGSEGGIGSTLMPAGLLASKGFVVLALPYFSHQPMGNLPRDLVNIPLEFFSSAASWLAELPFVNEGRVSMVGGSKGAEAALLVAAYFGKLESVAAYSPSSVSWAAPFAEGDQASWSLGGKPLPFVPYRRDPVYRPPTGFPNQLSRHYRYSLDHAKNRQEAAIPAERITGRILLISGGDDLIWDSSYMAGQIVGRLQEKGTCMEWLHAQYEAAGHSISTAILPTTWTPGTYRRWPNGGTPLGNAIAQRDSWKLLIAFLKGDKPVHPFNHCPG
jgi:dienelactone hydrolase